MPSRAPHACDAPGCPTRIRDGKFCEAHRRPAPSEVARGSSADRGYGSSWRTASLRHLRKEPLCRNCKSRGLTVQATQTDHIKPAREHPELFWDSDNWQSLCDSCHSSKTRAEMEARRKWPNNREMIAQFANKFEAES